MDVRTKLVDVGLKMVVFLWPKLKGNLHYVVGIRPFLPYRVTGNCYTFNAETNLNVTVVQRKMNSLPEFVVQTRRGAAYGPMSCGHNHEM